MRNLVTSIKTFMQDEEGLSVVEYVVGAGLLVTAIGVVFGEWGTTLDTELDNVFS